MRKLRLLVLMLVAIQFISGNIYAFRDSSRGEFEPAAFSGDAYVDYQDGASSVHDPNSLRIDIGIFGKDDLKAAYNDALFSSVHYLVLANGKSCSAFLIGRNYALTASHCLESGKPLYLEIDRSGQRLEKIGVAKSWKASEFSWRKNELGRPYIFGDYGIIRLVRAAPEYLKNVEFAGSADIKPGVKAISVGYPLHKFEGKTRVKDNQCTIRGLGYDVILSDCATAQGMSGGPLFILAADGKWKVAGIISSQYFADGKMLLGGRYSHDKANYFTNLTLYADRVLKVIRKDQTKTGLQL